MRSISYVSDGRFIVSSHPTLIRRFFKLPILDGVRQAMSSERYKSRSVNYLPGDYTVYRGVNRLTPNHLISSRFSVPVRYWPQKYPQDRGIDFLYDTMDTCLSSFFNYTKDKYSPIIPVTGGVDSRSLISHAHKKIKLDLYTWTDFNFNQAENETIERIVALTKASHHKTSVNQTLAKLGKERAEELSLLTRMNSGMTSKDVNRALAVMSVDQKIKATKPLPPVTVIGYGGEIVRGFHMRNRRDELSFPSNDTLTGMYGLGKAGLPSDATFSSFCTQAFRDFRSRTMFTEAALKGWSPYDVFYWEHRMGIWGSSTLDSMDIGGYTITALNSREVFKAALSLPNETRMDKTILLNYVRKNCKELADIPLH